MNRDMFLMNISVGCKTELKGRAVSLLKLHILLTNLEHIKVSHKIKTRGFQLAINKMNKWEAELLNSFNDMSNGVELHIHSEKVSIYEKMTK